MAEIFENLITCKDVQDRCIDWIESQRDQRYTAETKSKRKQSETEDDYNTDSEFDSVSECGSKKRRLGCSIKSEKLDLACDWSYCEYTVNRVERFASHVASHLTNLIPINNERGLSIYGCQWDSCCYETANPDEIARHVCYHAYHTKLKSIGRNIRGRIRLPRCRRDPDWKNVVDLPAPLLCRWEECLEAFGNYQYYLYHVAAHVQEGPRGNKVDGGVECKWTGCGTFFANLYKLRDHVRKHTKEKIVACPDCGATFASNTKFHVHCKRQIPIDVQGYQCSHCNKFYPTEGILRDHMRMHVFNYKCTLCEMSCESPASLAKHVRYRHVSSRNFPCQLCSHAAKSQQDLDTHMSVHTTGPNFSCRYEGCLYTCKGAYTLDRHIERVHGHQVRWYCCHECPIKYRKSHRLTQHLIAAHQLQLPSGHTRFQYTHDEDGCYRLQMVRYEAIEEENDSTGDTRRNVDKRYRIRTKEGTSVPRVEVYEVLPNSNSILTELEDDPDETSTGNELKSMPVISNILISMDETDAEGNIIRSKTVETQETTQLPPWPASPLKITNKHD